MLLEMDRMLCLFLRKKLPVILLKYLSILIIQGGKKYETE